MGKKLDALLRRGFKTRKFKATVNMAISRLAVLKNQHQAKYSVARSDVIQILHLGHHERALLRVEQVIKERNMLDVFTMIENYCYLLIERVNLLQNTKECPEELKEAISSMIYAATRCGDFPELQDLRAVFTSRFGKDFVARGVQLRNHCCVNSKMIQKLSTRMPSTENRVKMLKEIAQENNIILQIEEDESVHSEVKTDAEKKEDKKPETAPSHSLGHSEPRSDNPVVYEDVEMINGFSSSMKMRGKYKDVAHAAQAAFESAAYAAAAARAAVELSRSDSDDPRSPITRPMKVEKSPERIESRFQNLEINESGGVKALDRGVGSESENGEKHSPKAALMERSMSISSLESADNTLSSDEEGKITPKRTELLFDDSDYETVDGGRLLLSGIHVPDSGKNHTLQQNKDLSSEEIHTEEDCIVEESETKADSSDKLLNSQGAQFSAKSRPKSPQADSANEISEECEDNSSRNKAPASGRTRRTYRRK